MGGGRRQNWRSSQKSHSFSFLPSPLDWRLASVRTVMWGFPMDHTPSIHTFVWFSPILGLAMWPGMANGKLGSLPRAESERLCCWKITLKTLTHLAVRPCWGERGPQLLLSYSSHPSRHARHMGEAVWKFPNPAEPPDDCSYIRNRRWNQQKNFPAEPSPVNRINTWLLFSAISL